MFVSNTVSPIIVYLDKIFINILLPINQLLYYTIPYDYISKYLLVPSSIMTTLFPKIIMEKDNDVKTKKLFEIVFTLLLISGTIFVSAGIALSNEIFSIWLGEEYFEKSQVYIYTFIVGMFYNSMAQIPYYFIEGQGYPRYTALIQVIEFFAYLFALLSAIYFGEPFIVVFVWLARIVLDYIVLYIMSGSVIGLYYPNYIKVNIYIFIFIMIYFCIASIDESHLKYISYFIVLFANIFLIRKYDQQKVIDNLVFKLF